MQITEISYQELITTGKYENASIKMKASITKDDDLELCTAKLVRKVKRALRDNVDVGES